MFFIDNKRIRVDFTEYNTLCNLQIVSKIDFVLSSLTLASSNHRSSGKLYGRNFSGVDSSSCANIARLTPSREAIGESISELESLALIWNSTFISYSRKADRSAARWKLTSVSHHTIEWMPNAG